MKRRPIAERGDIYQIVTDRIIALLEQGTVPWHKPWVGGGLMIPRNLVSKKAYRGVNVFMLGAAGYGSPWWVSYKQALALGGHVKQGEKAHIAVFWKPLEVEDKESKSGKMKTVRLIRYYNVFNVEQCDGIKYPKPEKRSKKFDPIAEAEKIVSEMPNQPTITHNEQRAYYNRAGDIVNMPKADTFDKEVDYYGTLFHELTHSTGHESRLHRSSLTESAGFGTETYAKEELVAEIGASFLAANAEILDRTVNNSASYIAGWLKRLRNDNKLVVQAASQAHRAVDYILGNIEDEKSE
jgi:antirestriction protein ArdC